MKTKENILKDLANPIREAVLSAITPIISNAMTMYSDQQNKELSERVDELAIELHETRIKHDELFDGAEKIIKEKDAEIQRLMKELDEVKTSHYQKLDAQLVEDVERLTEENKELRDKVEWCDDEIDKQDAEIQRLTKEVDELKSRIENLKWVRENDTRPAELTRLRELLGMAYKENKLSIELQSKISTALNHKP